MKQFAKIFFSLFIIIVNLSAQGKVYLVLGSDTGIWEGLDVSMYYCTYNLGLYTDVTRNAYKVMDPTFRNQFKDSYGQSMKMTWWMMAGNVYRFATNNNVPVPNTMTLYLMRKYHGENAKLLGDELSLHYHTFNWTDYNNDGSYYWNQAKNFNECREDFDITMAQFLLDENTFPVSYRSGWHYMDNEWQNHIDSLIPYSLHNDYPAKRTSVSEPIDNVYDWSRSSKEFVPFHPSLSDYQVQGNGKGWNTRSYYMGSMQQGDMDAFFIKALNGVNQVPCLWAHLPEEDFPQNMKKIDSLAHISAAKYPSVKFMYCTAMEAMQRWRNGNDTTAPVITIQESFSGENVSFIIQTNENIFQAEPFVAIKDINEHYSILHCAKITANQWSTIGLLPKGSIAKIGVAVTDTMGNLATGFLNYRADDIYIDNLDNTYKEISGTWTTNSSKSWGKDSRQSLLSGNDTAAVQWTPNIKKTGLYNIFLQIPSVQNQVNSIVIKTRSNGQLIDSVTINNPITENNWTYTSTVQLSENVENLIQMIAYGKDQAGKMFCADVVKLSGLVKDRQIYTAVKQIQITPISEEDTVKYLLPIENHGIQNLTISEMVSVNNFLVARVQSPLIIPGMKKTFAPFSFYAKNAGVFSDTVILKSNDPFNPIIKIPVFLAVQPYFSIIDNDDSANYSEYGSWSKSVAQIWGSSSRYALSGNNASAIFSTQIKKNGSYEIFEIVPTTVNALTNALYIIRNGSDTLGTVTIDQNKGSGNWVSIGQYSLTNALPITVKVMDKGTASNLVLRADAVKFQLLTPSTVYRSPHLDINEFALEQNYPNPFNPITTIRFHLPHEMVVNITIYDMLGREVRTILRELQSEGMHIIQFNGSDLASGMYVYRITADSYTQSKTMMLLK